MPVIKQLPFCSKKRSEDGGLKEGAPELSNVETKCLPLGVMVSYFSYWPGPGFFLAVVNSSEVKKAPGLTVLGLME